MDTVHHHDVAKETIEIQTGDILWSRATVRSESTGFSLAEVDRRIRYTVQAEHVEPDLIADQSFGIWISLSRVIDEALDRSTRSLAFGIFPTQARHHFDRPSDSRRSRWCLTVGSQHSTRTDCLVLVSLLSPAVIRMRSQRRLQLHPHGASALVRSNHHSIRRKLGDLLTVAEPNGLTTKPTNAALLHHITQHTRFYCWVSRRTSQAESRRTPSIVAWRSARPELGVPAVLIQDLESPQHSAYTTTLVAIVATATTKASAAGASV